MNNGSVQLKSGKYQEKGLTTEAQSAQRSIRVLTPLINLCALCDSVVKLVNQRYKKAIGKIVDSYKLAVYVEILIFKNIIVNHL